MEGNTASIPPASQHTPDFLSSAGPRDKAAFESTGKAWQCPKTRICGHWGAVMGLEKLPVPSTPPSATNCSEGKQQVTPRQGFWGDSQGYIVLGDKPLAWMESVLDHFAPRHLQPFVIPIFPGSPSNSSLLPCHTVSRSRDSWSAWKCQLCSEPL